MRNPHLLRQTAAEDKIIHYYTRRLIVHSGNRDSAPAGIIKSVFFFFCFITEALKCISCGVYRPGDARAESDLQKDERSGLYAPK